MHPCGAPHSPHLGGCPCGQRALSATDSSPFPSTDRSPASPVPRQPSIEVQYSRKTPVEHVLLRPGMYVGPTVRMPPRPCWVPMVAPPLTDGQRMDVAVAAGTEAPLDLDQIRMVRMDYGLVPALNKVFDEILVNASDNRLRHPKSCTRVDVTIDPGCAETDRPPLISVGNDGKGVPIQVHQKEKMYVPELIFGHLMTGSNFDDNDRRVTGGRHGYGAKLTNIFSHAFTVETVDSRRGLTYRQTWERNMSFANEPEITDLAGAKGDYTRVTFVPDLPKLTGDPAAARISAEDYAVMCRRVIDVAGCAGSKLEVTLNGRRVPVAGFEQYAQLYRPEGGAPLRFQRLNQRWEVGVGLSGTGSFEAVSFVNGMATPRGGTHVDVLVQQVARKVVDRVARLHPDLAGIVTPAFVRRHLCVFVNCLIENPTFDSQMKESLSSSPSTFGSRYSLPERFLNDISREEDFDGANGEVGGPGIVEEVVRVARGRQQSSLLKEIGAGKKTKRKIISIPKLEDAHLAGTDEGKECALILTEGDSAKALAVAGLEVIGRERYGVFPLRGKFLNVRDASIDKLGKNAEVKAVCAILGLDFEMTYATDQERAELRYGHVMLMTDQDTDGSHIKGLMMNFFRHFWPELLKPTGDDPEGKPFLSSFVTPLMKVSKNKKEVMSFFSMAEYDEWRSSLKTDEIQRWNVKYYKGLGTSTPAEAKEYFKAFQEHHRPFLWKSEDDGNLLDMVFDKRRAADRRKWIMDEYDKDATTTVDSRNNNAVSFEDFVNNEMIHFSNGDNIRSLPSVIDGLKPSQRKVLYACFKRNLKKEIKVAQLAGYCAEHTAYHHGEASLHATIIGMAQDFVGSNNINLLVPSGQFGTRLTGGKDAASPRYIFTSLSPIARLLFPEIDDRLLEYREDEGQSIEPETFCPVIPLLLVNGSEGIGTGWSTSIPSHNPRDVLNYIRAKLNGTDIPTIKPWVRGFEGEIVAREDGKGYQSQGKVIKTSSTSMLISELPVGRWTNAYKQALLKLRDNGEINSIIEDHTTTSVSFTVGMKAAKVSRISTPGGGRNTFRLDSNILTTNMNAFDRNNVIQKFDSPESIAEAFFPMRLELYNKRKALLEATLTHSAALAQTKAEFISAVAEGAVDIVRGGKSKAESIDNLRGLGFATMSELDDLRGKYGNAFDGDTRSSYGRDEKEYDYLFNMPLSSFTSEKIASLHQEAKKMQHELDTIKRASPEDLWMADLDKLEPYL